MLNICIPIYNFDVRPLVAALDKEVASLKKDIELILIDDASDKKYIEINKEECNKHLYIQLEKNIGRASIRNLFLKYATHEYLLFLDCDSLIIDNNFIAKYLQCISTGNKSVICGGRVYSKTKPLKNKMLRWKYGIHKESQIASIRKLTPNHSFMTNNFVVNKAVLKKIQFDERLKKYGHEDTLFGFELLKEGIFVEHIENPVDNGDIENNIDFLTKTENGIHSLVSILEYVDYNPELIKMIKLARVMDHVNKWHLLWLVSLLFTIFKPILKYTLINGPINLIAFDLYKLGLLVHVMKR